MRITIEIDIPEGGMLSDWEVAYQYMDEDGDMMIGHESSPGLSGSQQVGLLTVVADAVRLDQASKWAPRRDDET